MGASDHIKFRSRLPPIASRSTSDGYSPTSLFQSHQRGKYEARSSNELVLKDFRASQGLNTSIHISLASIAYSLECQSLATKTRLHGAAHPKTMEEVVRIEQIWRRMGRWRDVEPLVVRILGFRRSVLGGEHAWTWVAMFWVAWVWMQGGRYSESKALVAQVVDGLTRVRGRRHLHTITAQALMGRIFGAMGLYGEAEKVQNEVFMLRKQVLGINHLDTIRAAAEIAVTWRAMGYLKKAEATQFQVLGMMSEKLGEQHPETSAVAESLAATRNAAKQGDERKKRATSVAEEKVLESRKRLLGPDHPNTIRAMANLAVLWSKVGRLEDAAELEAQVLELRKKAFGARHPKTVLAINNLALTRWQQKRYDEAKALMEQTTQLYEELLGKEHPEAVDAKKALSFMMEPVREEVGDKMIGPETDKGQGEHELDDEIFQQKDRKDDLQQQEQAGTQLAKHGSAPTLLILLLAFLRRLVEWLSQWE